MLAVYVTPLHTIALHYLLSVHLLQNVVTAEWAPGLVVFALAPAFAREFERSAAVRFVTHPLVALPVWLGTYFLWHVPPIYDKALEQSGWLLNLEHLTYFSAGVLMWWPVVHGRYSDGVKALYLFGAFVLAAPLGTDRSPPASRRRARGRRRRAHLELSLKTPAMCSVRRKRMKKHANTAKNTIACSTAIVTPAICWSVSSERPHSCGASL